jgi:hypothetical protein
LAVIIVIAVIARKHRVVAKTGIVGIHLHRIQNSKVKNIIPYMSILSSPKNEQAGARELFSAVAAAEAAFMLSRGWP